MKEIGSLLRQAREDQGISLEEISKETKIQKRFLSLLEEGDFSVFPGEVYLKGALRNFAEAVGLKPVEIIMLFEQSKQGKNSSVEYKWRKNIRKRAEIEEIGPVMGRGKKTLPVTALVWILLLVFIGGGSIWYRYQHLRKKGESMPYPEITAENKPENTLEKPGFHEIVPAEEMEPVGRLTLISSSSSELIYLLDNVKQQEISLSFTGNCWFRFEQDGRLIKEKTGRAGEAESFGDSKESWFRLGNPPAVKVKVNGMEINDLVNYAGPVNITIKKE